jgi:hypothetical protein
MFLQWTPEYGNPGDAHLIPTAGPEIGTLDFEHPADSPDARPSSTGPLSSADRVLNLSS